jgi:hypothetical protein
MSRALRNIYLLRVVFSGLWVALVLSVGVSTDPGAPVGALIALLLGAYPAADLAASIADLRSDATGRATAPQWINAITDTAAVILIAVGASHSLTAAMDVIAGWAIVSGAIQLILGVRRLGRVRGQGLMIISGGGSIFAGTTFIDWSQSPSTAVHTLAQYSIGGAVWYLLTALWLLLARNEPPSDPDQPPVLPVLPVPGNAPL